MRLFDTPGDTVAEITTDGSTIKPFLNAVEKVASEVKLEFTDTGLYVRMVNAPNVMMGEFNLDATEFKQYDLEAETTVGIDVSECKKLVRRARKNHADELTLHVQHYELTAEVSRGYENTEVVSQGSMELVDPDSIRKRPEFPDLDRTEFTVDYEPLADALSYGMGTTDYVAFETKAVNQHSHALYIGGETDTRDETAAIKDVDIDESVGGKFDTGYMGEILSGLSEVSPSEVRVKLGDEFPVTFSAKCDGFEATYMIAPRITSD